MEMNESQLALETQINRTVGFLLGMADGLDAIAPDKAERCRGFSNALEKAAKSAREKLSPEGEWK